MAAVKNNTKPVKPCKKCGHPGPFIPKVIKGQKDPREGIKIFCACCKRDITYDTHQWRDDRNGKWVCCDCVTPTKPLRDLTTRR